MEVMLIFYPLALAMSIGSILEVFTTSKTDRHLLRQKVRQIISVMKTNNGGFVVFTTKRELKCQNELFL